LRSNGTWISSTTTSNSGNRFAFLFKIARWYLLTFIFVLDKWVSQCTYRGHWQEKIFRSALVLKLLTYEKTGAILAALTFGLPEALGGARNWDYR
jgi:GH15 family glucan-1,4-alpha-glucosidase